MPSAVLLRASLLAIIAPVLPACGNRDTTKIREDVPFEPVLVGGKPTGIEESLFGTIHVKEKLTCPSLLPRAEACQDRSSLSIPEVEPRKGACSIDADCRERPGGYCRVILPLRRCGCAYGCTTDVDCAADEACLCGNPVGHCVKARCRSDADCHGVRCMGYDSSAGCGDTRLACLSLPQDCQNDDDCRSSNRGPQDQCQSDDDCVGFVDYYCTPNPSTGTGPWSCRPHDCIAGRPLLVAGRDTLAPLRRGAWG